MAIRTRRGKSQPERIKERIASIMYVMGFTQAISRIQRGRKSRGTKAEERKVAGRADMPMMAKKSPWFFKTKARIKEMTVTPKPRSKPITRRAKTPPSPAAMRTPKINPKPNRITHWSVVLILTARKRPTRIEAREIGVLIKRKRE